MPGIRGHIIDLGIYITICIQGPSYPTTPDCKTFSSPDGLVQTWENLIPGDYTITENDPGPNWDVDINPSTVTVHPGDDPNQATVTVTNTFLVGSLTITKDVIGAPDLPLNFEICISGPTYPTGKEEGACHTFTSDLESYTWDDLTPGTYTFFEIDPGPYWKVSYDPMSQELVVVAGQTVEGTVTNEQQYLAYTPGFWKNHGPSAPSGHNAWVYTTYTVTQEVCTPFPAACSTEAFWDETGTAVFGKVNLFDALSLQGGRDAIGGAEILLRHAVAALLNADLIGYLDDQGLLGGFLPYPKTVAEVISEVNAALETGDRQTMLDLAAELDKINNGGSDYFDWTWPKP